MQKQNNSPKGVVILLHGLRRKSRSMAKMAAFFQDNGYITANINYPSTKKKIEDIAADHLAVAVEDIRNKYGKSIPSHFITHSMGGIIVRSYLQTASLPQGSRIVMLAPPNHGSEIVDKLRKFKWFKRIMGIAALQLSTDKDSVPNSLKRVSAEIGIIMGASTIDPVSSKMLPSGNDGKVTIESARLEEMSDFLLITKVSHAFIMKNKIVMQQALYFVENGAFLRDNSVKLQNRVV